MQKARQGLRGFDGLVLEFQERGVWRKDASQQLGLELELLQRGFRRPFNLPAMILISDISLLFFHGVHRLRH